MHYSNLTITVSPKQQDGYLIEIRTNKSGRSSGYSVPDAHLLKMLECVNDPVKSQTLTSDTLRSTGDALYNWLLAGPRLADFRVAWDRAIRNEQGLRICLSIDASEVAAWPWELLYDSGRDLYLATQVATPVVRLFERTDVSSGRAKGGKRLPFRLLSVAPSAPDLDLKSERMAIENAIAQLGSNVKFDVLDGKKATKTRLKDFLYSAPYDILHFSGHGGCEDGHGYLRLLREDGSEEFVKDEVFAQMCLNARSLRLIVLNACVAGRSDAGQAFGGLALRVLQKGVPAVIAMQFALSDPAAANFASDFYRYLCRGESLGRADLALTYARSTLLESYPDTSFFAAPVLYTRVPDCVIFTRKAKTRASKVLSPPGGQGLRSESLREPEEIMSPPDSLDARLKRWLAAVGLRTSPFVHWNAEQEPDLPDYFVDVDRFDELLVTTAPCVVFAARGCGKTAQRRMLAAQCRPERTDTGRLAVHYIYGGFQRALQAAGGDPVHMCTDHHAVAILHHALDALREAGRHDRQLAALLERPDLAFRLQALTAHDASSTVDLDAFVGLLADCGLGPLVILVDGLDEFPPLAGDPPHMADFLAPLLGTLPFIERPGVAFKFFLPQEAEAELRRRPWFRPDRLHIFSITWNRERLQEMLGQRLAHFSAGGGRVYTRLGQLCRADLAGRIDAELVSLAGGLPRAALALADMLLRGHCRAAAEDELIASATWEEVKRQWDTRKADFFRSDATPLSVPGAGWPPLVVDEKAMRVWVGDREITSELTAQEFRVLLALYRHVPAICSGDLLIAEAWTDVKAREGVSDQAIAATISRLRKCLGQPSAERGYIETVKGRGYRLHPHGFGPVG